MRALVTSWSSFVHGEATAGDLLAAETATRWLAEAAVPHDVALSPVFGSGVLLDDVDPGAYTHLVFVCGPAAGWQVEDLLGRFAHCVKVAVGVSVVDGTPPGFDAVISRDGPQGDRPDLSLGAPADSLPPLVAVVRSHAQREYPDARHDAVHQVVDRVLRAADVAVVEVDTRVDPREVVGRRAQDVEAALARVDAVVSTRMHGLVLPLRHGVPVVAVDAVPGGAKVSRQAAVLGWPGVLSVDELNDDQMAERLRWALSPEARQLARRRAEDSGERLADVRAAFLAALGEEADGALPEAG